MEQDAAPAGSGESTAQPAAAPGDWRAEECRDRALLAVAFMALRRAGIADVVVPPPLLPGDEAFVEPLARRIHEVLIDAVREETQEPRTREETHREIRSVLNDVEDRAWTADRMRTIGGLDAWRPWDCIRWWVAAGETLTAARTAAVTWRAGVRELRAASKRALEQPDDPFTNPRDGMDARLESNLRKADRLDALLANLEDRIGCDSPPFWCADQKEPLRLTSSALAKILKLKFPAAMRLQRRLDVPSAERREHLERLVAVHGVFVPISPDPFQKQRVRLVDEARRLLGMPCVAESESWPHRQSIDRWMVIRGDRKRPVTRPTISLGSPLFVVPSDAPGERRLVADGVVLVSQAATIVKRMKDWVARRAASDEAPSTGLERAIGMAAQVDWGDEPQFWKTLVRPAPGRGLAAIVAAWQAVTRLLVTTMDFPRGDAGAGVLEPPGEFRLATLLEGFELTTGGADTARRIPRHIDEPIAIAAEDAVHLHLPEGAPLPVGRPSAPARCTPEIFAAVEDLDWLLWAMDAVATSSTIAPENWRKFLNVLLTIAKYRDDEPRKAWEPLKARLLELDDDAEAIAAGFRGIYVPSLQLKWANRHRMKAPDPLVTILIDGFDRCALALLRRLHEVDPAGLVGLDPPRSRDGTIDVFRWRADRCRTPGSPTHCEVAWAADPAPFGMQLDEEVTPEKTILVTFSASPAATDADVRMLETAIDTARSRSPTDACFAPLVHLAGAILDAPAGEAEMPDVPAALARLREEFAGPGRIAFDALIHAATSSTPDPLAVAWVEILRAEHDRFAFECHPPIGPRPDGRGFAIGPVSADDTLAWEDSDTVPVGTDVRVRYATARHHAERVVSRGRPEAGSAEHLAAALESLCGSDLSTLEPLARALRREIDVARTFPDIHDRGARPLADALCAVFDGIVAHASPAVAAPSPRLAEAFGIATRISDRLGHPVTPDRWHPEAGTPASEVPDVEALGVAFHPTVPAGDVIVERFHVAGEPARGGLLRRSAGPPPAGYDCLRALTGAVAGDDLRCRELRQAVADLPRHVLGAKGRLAIPSLYESVWNVLVEHPAAAGDPAPWKAALADLIRKPYDMVMFEPSKLGDYPVAWTVGPDGNSPRGRRIARVIRPGVRTLDKKLVWPAIVETE